MQYVVYLILAFTQARDTKGGDNMLNKRKLKAKMVESGIDGNALANIIGKSTWSTYRKINGETEFKTDEINAIRNGLPLTDEEVMQIFFA